MEREYRIEITEFEDDLGGGYLASIPQLGSEAFRGYGDTKKEALANLKEVKKHLLGTYRALRIAVPLPDERGELIESKERES